MNNKKRDAIILCRISDENQIDGFSLDAQESACRAYCEEGGLKIISIHKFQETASKASERKKFHEVLGECKTKPESKILVVEKRDRLTRNFTDRTTIIELIMRGLEIYFVRERKVIDKNVPPEEWLVDGIMTSVNEYTSLNLAREAIKGMVQRAQTGQPNCKAPLGYAYSETADNPLDKKRRRGRVLTKLDFIGPLYGRMVELRMRYESVPYICKTVLAEGLVPLERVKTFTPNFCDKMLKNPMYAGKFNFRRILYDGSYESVISWDKWERLQRTFLERGKYKKRNLAPFQDVLRCAECDCKITFEMHKKRSGKKFGYYRCSNGKKYHSKANGTAVKYIAERDLHSQLFDALETIVLPYDWAKEIAIELNAQRQQATEVYFVKVREIEARLSDVESKITKTLDNIDVIPTDIFKKRMEDLKWEKDSVLEEKRLYLDNANREEFETARSVIELSKSMKSLLNLRSDEEKYSFVKSLLLNCRLRGVTIEIDWEKPFDVIAEMNRKSNWRFRYKYLKNQQLVRRDSHQ